jgi:hypothetical protein
MLHLSWHSVFVCEGGHKPPYQYFSFNNLGFTCRWHTISYLSILQIKQESKTSVKHLCLRLMLYYIKEVGMWLNLNSHIILIFVWLFIFCFEIYLNFYLDWNDVASFATYDNLMDDSFLYRSRKKGTLLWANDMGTHKVVEFHCLSWFVTIMSATRFFFLNWCNGSNHCYAWQGSWVIYFTSWIMQYRGFARIWSMGRDPWGPAESWILVSARNTPSSSVHG